MHELKYFSNVIVYLNFTIMKYKTRKGCKSTRMKTRRIRIQHGGMKHQIYHRGKFVGEYEGEVDKFNQPQGPGKMTQANGTVYEGDFKDGLANGSGKCKFSNGDVYEGEFKNDLMHGKGKCVYADGEVYEGNWLNNAMTHGVLKFNGGDVYEGDFVNGERHGIGIMRYTDGDVYEGEYANGQRHGRGKITANGDVYIGTWNHDDRHGIGKCEYVNRDVYEGKWQNNAKNGQGTMTYANGNVYEGEWIDDAKNGQGTMTYANGHVYHGYWADDVITGVSARTRASGIPPDPFEIGVPSVSTDIFTMTTTRRPEATIELSDGRKYNIAQARGLHHLIATTGALQTELRVQLTPHDKAMLDQFVNFSMMGGKKRRNTQKRLRRSVGNTQ